MSSPLPPVPLLQLFLVFFRVGMFSFGGGLAGWIYREVVTLRGWISDPDFFSGLALAQTLPGANVTNLSVYIGQRLRGSAGAFAALAGLLSGPFFAVIGLVVVYDRIGVMPAVQDALTGAAAAAIGLLLMVAVKGTKDSCRRLAPALIFVATFVAVGVLQWPLIPVVVALVPPSVFFAWSRVSPDA
jgi:chromate transporter